MGYQIGVTNEELRDMLKARDGNYCQMCELEFDDEILPTLDHIMPQSWCRDVGGWTLEETHHLDNLQLLCGPCNRKKDSFLYDEFGNLEVLANRKPKIKIVKPDIMNCCNNGRKIYPGDVCIQCGHEAAPKHFPAVLKKSPKDCLHVDTDFCYMCLLDFVPRGDDGFDWRKLYG